MPRKTIEVKKLKDRLNKSLSNEKLSQEEKRFAATLLEFVLTQSDDYHGFGFLNPSSRDAHLRSVDDPNYYSRVYY